MASTHPLSRLRNPQLLAGLWILASGCASDPSRPPVTPARNAGEVIADTRWLERHPLDPKAQERRRRVLLWWTDSGQPLTLDTCLSTAPGGTGNRALAPLVVGQHMLGLGAYLLEHPTEPRGGVDAKVAGLLSALRLYESAIEHDAGLVDPYYETLRLVRDAGRLAAHVRARTRACAN